MNIGKHIDRSGNRFIHRWVCKFGRPATLKPGVHSGDDKPSFYPVGERLERHIDLIFA